MSQNTRTKRAIRQSYGHVCAEDRNRYQKLHGDGAQNETKTLSYNVCKPVVTDETQEYTVCVPHTETREGMRTVCKVIPVTKTRTVTVDEGHWEQASARLALPKVAATAVRQQAATAAVVVTAPVCVRLAMRFWQRLRPGVGAESRAEGSELHVLSNCSRAATLLVERDGHEARDSHANGAKAELRHGTKECARLTSRAACRNNARTLAR